MKKKQALKEAKISKKQNKELARQKSQQLRTERLKREEEARIKAEKRIAERDAARHGTENKSDDSIFITKSTLEEMAEVHKTRRASAIEEHKRRSSLEFDRTGGVVTSVATEHAEPNISATGMSTNTDPFEFDDDVEGSFGFPSGSESD